MARTETSVILDEKELQRRLRALKGQPVRVVSDGTDYGIYQHEGFVHWKSGNYIPGKPFMQMGLDEVQSAFKQAMGQAIAKGNDLEPVVQKVAEDVVTIARREAPYATGQLHNSIDVHPPEDFGVDNAE